ncbi:MAG: hypothetical protein AAB594_03630 [Patescibacteria group bacterium]
MQDVTTFGPFNMAKPPFTCERHVLQEKSFRVSKNWQEWKGAWDSAERFDELMGLLHSGFSPEIDNGISIEESCDRLCFYLSVADGFKRYRHMLSLNPSERLLAEKAWKMLCGNFFATAGLSDYVRGRRESVMFSQRVLTKLLWFFDPRRENLSIGDDGHKEKLAAGFMRFFVGKVWHWGNCYDKKHPSFSNLSQESYAIRPQLVRLMDYDGHLDFLREKGVIEKLDADTLILFEKMALEGIGASWSDKFPVNSLSEAVGNGSELAEIVMILKEKVAFSEKQKLLQEAERERRVAEEKITRLSGSASK